MLVQDKNEVQHQISVLLFIGLACGFLMLFFTRCYGVRALTGKGQTLTLTIATIIVVLARF